MKTKRKYIFIFSILIIILYTCLKLSIIAMVNIYLSYLLQTILYFLCLISIFFITVSQVIHITRNNQKRCIGMIFLAFSIFLLFGLFINNNRLIKEEFIIQQKEYNLLLSLLNSQNNNSLYKEQIKNNMGTYWRVKLPLRYRYLSVGGYVLFEKINGETCFFFVKDVDLTDFKLYGYVYTSKVIDGKSKLIFDEVINGELIELYDGWYYNIP